MLVPVGVHILIKKSNCIIGYSSTDLFEKKPNDDMLMCFVSIGSDSLWDNSFFTDDGSSPFAIDLVVSDSRIRNTSG